MKLMSKLDSWHCKSPIHPNFHFTVPWLLDNLDLLYPVGLKWAFRSTSSLLEQCSVAGTSCSGLCNKNRNSSDAKIEVCMGWKCKKSGAGELLDKFRSVVGIEGAVSGCKCMGKCRDGPIVKVLNVIDEAKSVRALSNPFCIGVGLKDVDMIVANFVGA